MVITGATGAIGGALKEHFHKHYEIDEFDIRKESDLPDCGVLINCMGTNIDGKLHKIDYLDWLHVASTNLAGAIEVIQMALPGMRQRRYGRIINLSSILSEGSVPGTSAYTASKAGLNAAIRVIAKENAKHDILINNLNLGYFDLGMTRKINNYKDLKKQIPIGKFGNVKEIIRACEFLIGSDYITGTTINISGGLW